MFDALDNNITIVKHTVPSRPLHYLAMKQGNRILPFLPTASAVVVTAPPQHIARGFPLAPLPNSMLFRSLFIAGISSRRILLLPSLKILSFLSRPGRGFLFNVDKNPIVHGVLKKTFYDQFCAGENGQETRQCVSRLKGLGFKGVILTYARETVFDHKTKTADVQGVDSQKTAITSEDAFCSQIDEWRVGTLKTIDLIDDGDFLAVK
jgi:hypothetical protein